MKENEIPTKDLKTGAKVVGIVGKSVFESAKPHLKRELGKKIGKMLQMWEK